MIDVWRVNFGHDLVYVLARNAGDAIAWAKQAIGRNDLQVTALQLIHTVHLGPCMVARTDPTLEEIRAATAAIQDER